MLIRDWSPHWMPDLGVDNNGTAGADGGQDRTDPSAPLAGADPAPCHDVRQSKKQLVVGALVAILEPVSNAGLAYELE